ncbi:hypothetical protein PV05_09371 [Exophiala xenobiotica]|uniref:Uncharacterized protein n=1 Tax=Exophiala xenobiotica TaxID=348802 RepID=A0A0D2CL78_9EURO|nr:uncharacterized protein PV05_09371 [Exophiala xenobiotica]KIW50572.1 hypothetical protein PV05_09371 [Exophiala xenobiotica]
MPSWPTESGFCGLLNSPKPVNYCSGLHFAVFCQPATCTRVINAKNGCPRSKHLLCAKSAMMVFSCLRLVSDSYPFPIFLHTISSGVRTVRAHCHHGQEEMVLELDLLTLGPESANDGSF